MTNATYEKLIQLALMYSASATKPPKQYHVTFILDRNKIIATGFNNKTKTHPMSPHPYKTIHSEIDAILKINIADECKMYHFINIKEVASRLDVVNVRVTRHGDIALAKPCSHCWRLINELGFRRVFWSISDWEFDYDIFKCK